ncbi:MAG: methyltransferase [Candidatus Thermoplasmatota archaeon]|nr:methyltransferase [Candidatus Thermoplasmatota archaeon]
MHKSFLKDVLDYAPPKELRTLFIVHYSPLLLMILIGPLTAIYKVFELPIDVRFSTVTGVVIFLLGTFVYFKWEIHWHKTFHGQLVTGGIFKYIRHPHYTSLLIIGFGLAFFFYSIVALAIAIIAVPIMIWSIFDEEKILLRQYGDEYRKFMKKTPWRLIPKIF